MNIAILGYDIEGRASFTYWSALGHSVSICDRSPEVSIPSGAKSQLGDKYLDNLDSFDLLVRTPGLHPQTILDKNPNVANRITSGTNEFLAVCPTKNIIGVTGTKGKGTTSTLITKMLEASGKTVHLGGNIGRAALDMLPEIQPDDWVVLELSNFQLIDLQSSPRLAVCLMVVPEHLDWHKSVEEYFAAKKQLFSHQTTEDIAIYYSGNETSAKVASMSPGIKIPFYEQPGAYIQDGAIVIDDRQIYKTSNLKLLGEHNWQNACAAVTAVWQVAPDIPAIQSVLKTFSGLEHRLEFVREHNGVQYYNDSFGTTPETAIVALQAFDTPKVVILGGSDKGVSFDELAKTVKAHSVRAAVVIGNTAPAIRKALETEGFTNIIDGGNTMREIVANAKSAAQPGDIILLSTGCASFGLFANYKDRGNQFKTAVNAL